MHELLYVYIEYDDYEILNFLAKKKVSFKPKEDYYNLVLDSIKHSKDPKTLKALLDGSANTKEKDKSGYSAIELAIKNKKLKFFDLLLPYSNNMSNADLLTIAKITDDKIFSYVKEKIKNRKVDAKATDISTILNQIKKDGNRW